MSHEGIRILDPETARREDDAARPLPAAAVTPTKVRVMKSEGTGMSIDWQDNHFSSWTFGWLRDACPCATCNEERKADGREPGTPKPRPGGPLVMYQAPARPTEVTPVGKYALKFKWNDGHDSGIYSWDFLRRVCQCAQCKKERVANG